jgi:hypothetical protein
MKIVYFRTITITIFSLLVGVSTPGIGQAGMAETQDLANFEVLEAVDNTILDSMRGGFVTGNGVRLDIGVEKASYVDGVLQVQNAFRVEDIALLQQGFGGNVSASDLQNVSSAFNTLIQNNLDQKTIQNYTVIDVNVRNFGNLQNGFVESIRGLQDVQIVR